jgi:NCAIR mutase (PurE)-related protein
MKKLLQDYKAGKVNLETVLQKLRSLPYEDLEFAKIDTHREIRKGFPETIFCQGKTLPQIIQILKKQRQAKPCIPR